MMEILTAAWNRIRPKKWGECYKCGSQVQSKSVLYINKDGPPNDLSIYGPYGSYRFDMSRCPKCDLYTGRQYDTFGSIGGTSGEIVKRAWEAAGERKVVNL